MEVRMALRERRGNTEDREVEKEFRYGGEAEAE
jgi:hypothetical protein